MALLIDKASKSIIYSAANPNDFADPKRPAVISILNQLAGAGEATQTHYFNEGGHPQPSKKAHHIVS